MRNQAVFVFLLYFLFVNVCPSNAQRKRNDLEREKLENQQKISETNKILDETRSKKTATIGQLNVVSQQIKEKSEVIRVYIKEIRTLESEVVETQQKINKLETQVAELKKEYAILIYSSSKTLDAQNKLLFLFSAKDFNQLAMRLRYFKYYSQARQQQTNQIKKAAFNLRLERKRLNEIKAQKQLVLGDIRNEHTNLKGLKSEQENTVQLLAKQEEKLLDEIEERKKSVKKLEKLITDMIKRELEKLAALDKKNIKTPENTKLSSSFAGNKSKMFWPTEHGFISEPFGTHPHPVLPRVTVINHGVNIQTTKNEKARTVFEGIITAVAEVPGMNYAVMIQHGDYYTFYAKLKTTFVKVGQKVKAKEYIGEVYTTDEEVTELQFQIWKGFDKQDPEQWLYPR